MHRSTAWGIRLRRQRHAAMAALAAAVLVGATISIAPPAFADGPWPGSAGPQAAHDLYGYPYASAPDCVEATGASCVADKWLFYQGQCVSWVAYRINQLNGIAFDNYYGGGAGRWGSATDWGSHAQSLGIRVDGTPAVGSVAWYSFGHVAYVEQVNSPTSVVISEMNYDDHNGFRLRTITTAGGWPSGFIHIHDTAGAPPPPPTPLVIRQSGSNAILGKVGPDDAWTTLADSLPGKIYVSGTRIAVLTPSGELFAKDGLSGTWYDEASGVTDFGLSPDLLAIHQSGTGELLGKVGLNDAWTTVSGDMPGRITVADGRLAVLTPSGELFAKDGLDGTWYDEAGGVTGFDVSPDLLVIQQAGTAHLLGKVGLDDAWTTLADDLPGKVEVAGTRLAVLTPSGELYAKDGLNGTWYDEANSVTKFDVSPGAVVIHQSGTDALVGKVGLDDAWTTLADDLPGKIVVAGSRISDLTPSGELFTKDGLNGTWFPEADSVTALAGRVPPAFSSSSGSAPAPVATPSPVGPPVAAALARIETFTWGAPADGVVSNVRVQTGDYTGAVSDWAYPSSWQRMSGHGVSISATPGRRYCVQVQAVDGSGFSSGWSKAVCVTRALDDRALHP